MFHELKARDAMDEKKRTMATESPIDVVIPVIAKDFPIAPLTVESARQHISGVRDVFLVCPRDEIPELTVALGDRAARIVEEESFPYRPKIEDKLHHFKERAGWFVQQLVKLCAPLDIPDISENVLSVDGDVVFHQPTDFLPDNVPQYLCRKFRITPYFDYIERNFGYPAQHPKSGVCHLMLFQRSVLLDMKSYLEERQGREAPLWDLLVKGLKDEYLGMSEYEIYFNFIHRFKERYAFDVTSTITYADLPRRALEMAREENYVAYHSYLK